MSDQVEKVLVHYENIIKEQQEEINRLTIAYQNASEQRQHYVDKCLMLSEVVLDMHKLIDSMFKNSSYLPECIEREYVEQRIMNKDLIQELKRNL